MTFGLPKTIPSEPAAPGGPPAPAKKPGAAGWARSNPTLALGGAGIALVLVVALASKKNAAAAAGADSGTTATTTAGGNNAGTFDSTANDIYNSLMSQINSLSTQISGLTPGPSNPTPPPVVKKPVPVPVVKKPVTKPVAKKPAPAPVTYTVKKGDTLTAIAGRLGLPNWQTLYNTNKTAIGSNPNLIHPGLVLKK